MGAILAWLGAWFARLIGVGAVRAVVWKVIFYALFVTVLPAVLYNLLSSLIGEMMTLAGSYSSSASPLSVSFTGFLGWLAYHFKIPECFAVILSGLTFRVTMSFIPFLNRV